MITEDELRISNLSYTNKDFASIYPELLDLAKSISPRWDPTQTNESDPGLVLLKLLAFIGDKTNYNSDKNVLECFMPSATQDKSMRAICETNGYFPKYYQSARTKISFRYDGELNSGDAFDLPAFDTVVSDEDGEISYSLIEPCKISSSREAYSANAIQGTFETLSIGDRESVQLTDLDDSNRVYLPESMVAQNGVFVFDSKDFATTYENSWEQTDNLNLVTPADRSAAGKGKYFRVGYDSEQGVPYVEFPDNIAELIGSGLTVKYCKTAGKSGNVSAGALSVLTSPSSSTTTGGSVITLISSSGEMSDVSSGDSSSEGTLVVKNTSSTISGSDPESIDEAYSGYKKTVGTFDTLITCRDYANAIYGMTGDDTGLPIVSNVAVADRRTDINYGGTVATFSEAGKTYSYVSGEMTPYDICLYPLNPLGESYTSKTYASSFKPLSNADLLLIESTLEDSKTISHNYKSVIGKNDSIYAVKNYYGINAVVTTSYKVNSFEQAEIKDAIAKALMKAFNGRKVDYGYELPFDSILKVIEGADSRIRNVSLDEPDVISKVMGPDGVETPLLSESDGVRKHYLRMLAKNILAGRVPLFDYDEDFTYEYGMSNIDGEDDYKAKYVYEIDTNTKIDKDESGKGYGSSGGYALRDNEVVQLISPNLSSRITYPAYVNYRMEFALEHSQKDADEYNYIPRNMEYQLMPGDKLMINYTDSNSTVHDVIFTNCGITDNGVSDPDVDGTVIIRPNFDLYEVKAYSSTNKRSSITKGGYDYYTLSTNETIEDRRRVRRTIDNPYFACYWSTSSANNALFTESDKVTDDSETYYERLLGDNEYFAYTDSSKTELVVLQSGTKLIYKSASLGGTDWTCDDSLISDVMKNGMSLFEDFNWKYINFGVHNLIVEDMQILTLTSGDKLKITMPSGKSGAALPQGDDSIDSKWKPLSIDAEIKYGSDLSTSLPQPSVDGMQWQIRSRLALNCGPSKAQYILSGQTVDIMYAPDSVYDGKEKSKSEMDDVLSSSRTAGTRLNLIGADADNDGNHPVCLRTNISYSGVSGGKVSTVVSNISADGTSYTLDVSALAFKGADVKYIKSSGEPVTMSWASGYCVIPVSSLKYTDSESTVTLNMLSDGAKTRLIMLYASGLGGSDCTISAKASSECLRLYNSGKQLGSSVEVSDGINVIEIKDSSAGKATALDLVFSSPASTPSSAVSLTVGKLSVVEGINSAFRLLDGEESALLSSLGIDGFYYNLPVDGASQIEGDDMTKPSILWDRNNVYNRMTIGEIDFGSDAFKISIAKSSRSVS
jgi:hypothetical protein